MRITDVEVILSGTSWRNLTFVKVCSDDGLTGFGEATVEYREEAVAAHIELAGSRIVGLDPTNQSQLWATLVAADFMAGDAVATAAASGILIACLDITGKARDLPLHRLLGGAVRERVPVYANGWYRGERTPETFARLAQRVAEQGYRALKVDPFGTAGTLAGRQDLLEARDLLSAIREAVGRAFQIYVDAHGRLTPARAREAAQLFAPLEIGFLEEPVGPHNLTGMRELRGHSDVPIAAGERSIGRWGFRNLIEQECVDIVQPDITWCGGPSETLRIAFLAELHQMVVSLHNANSPLATAVGCQVGAVLPNLLVLEMFDDFDDPWVLQAVHNRPQVQDGFLPVSQAPGIGVAIDEHLLRARPPRRLFMDIEKPGWELRESDIAEAPAP